MWLFADRVANELRTLGARWVEVHPSRKRLNLLKVREFARRAGEAIGSCAREIDVVHGNGFVLTRRHHVNTSHFVHAGWRTSAARSPGIPRTPREGYHALYTVLNARWERDAYENAAVVVAVSELVRAQLIEIGVPEERIRVIRNGVDLREFSPGPGDRTSYHLPEGAPLAVFVGEIQTRRKNLETVLAALRQVPTLHLAVVGSTEGSPYPSLASRLGVDKRVHFLGYRTDTASIMRCADAFLLPARYDPCPLVLLEALATGLPIITATTVGGSELVGDTCGIVVSDPNDVDRFADAVTRLLEDDTRVVMSEAARRVAERHSWDRVVKEYVALYREVQS